ncbi:hypothetical protein CO057_02565 [Candidatus Uhrbacteria bacterium CG_4_9_14_0_2_um_filter_41_50]|uniref:tRNA/rRNA methyltransferase SpoU type domain-containing protein n=1 Tax=Candidatus Uhrbacteria bacterium CG_4_9_14_0_2_um_filter_41_50 TaxID=1975031 RepID=A0A2M8EP57_9BACT|nr:MAG: hypothetical protein COZ45_04420 [Candidatus Uhrbacteria bacterium CG_4_10_14_3_um_filter_41_21]PIZ55064.1 MAG: hypothetical protein COY24_01730 [Candidatus Uhrbacteria bacterium CG_4_10_14_0_2_um_filter_41_21]PJB85018.1 MAG: hypothetical protein CO086_00710 [Candidatus Uhrbacteria bacterium CG_4_9_14_0_8_um_filter_41_16]PJC24525.1 MAG: hypothetical protein CO057_02565 [Candidatus Uhrbacteria bacterium CG_4_9_14_0_2_um_filter_41_50]PJE74751.1 MAG: hypothetical protein COV03_04035 [Candi
MLSKAQEKKITALRTKKGREKHKCCLVEGQKVISEAGDFVELIFKRTETEIFDDLVTTETPQDIAAIAKIPEWTLEDVKKEKTILVLDGVQDPGNVGTILRLCLGFDAGLIFVESADPTSSKVIRSSAGAMFKVAWIQTPRSEIENQIAELGRNVYLLEKRDGSKDISSVETSDKKLMIIGSEGSGIKILAKGASIAIEHNPQLESLNVASAVAILLYSLHKK